MDVNCSNVNVSVNASEGAEEYDSEVDATSDGSSRTGTELTNYLYRKLENAEARLEKVEKTLEERLQNQDIEINKRIEKAFKYAANKKRL